MPYQTSVQRLIIVQICLTNQLITDELSIRLALLLQLGPTVWLRKQAHGRSKLAEIGCCDVS